MIFTNYFFRILKTERLQFRIFLFLSIVIGVFTIAVNFIEPSVFKRFLGNLNPLTGISISIFLGFLLWGYLISVTDLRIYRKQSSASYFVVAGIALLFGIEVIAADIWLVDYSKDINIPFPESLPFYPAIAYIVEVFFHLLPISIIVFLLSSFSRLGIQSIVWISILSVSILEPVYQLWFAAHYSLVTLIYTGLHVFLFSLTQLIIFKRLDFLSMYMFRILFYLIWHILWGHLRLNLFF